MGIARGHGWCLLQELDLRGARAVGFFVEADGDALGQLAEGVGGGDLVHLDPIAALVLALRMEKGLVQAFVIGEEQQALAVFVEPTDRIDIRWEWVFQISQCAVLGCFSRKLGEHPIGFVKDKIAVVHWH